MTADRDLENEKIENEKGSSENGTPSGQVGPVSVAVVESGTHVPDHVSFAEFRHYADLQREYEKSRYEPSIKDEGIKALFTKVTPEPLTEKDKKDPVDGHELTDLELEKVNAQRMLRQAGWASVFFLITTDILGPSNAPFAISQNGFVPGVILYTVFGIAAAYGGVLLSWMYCHLDSDRYPIRTYGDLTHRLFGKSARHLASVLQSLQLIVNVGQICLSNGQSLSQITKGHLCFSVCIVIWAFCGMIIGQIRTLARFTLLANWAVWCNLLTIFISMGVIAHSVPNFAAAVASYGPAIASGPVTTSAFSSGPIYAKVNGMMNMVFAYGGAMIFPEMMAEMRRPWDFWKGMAAAQILIYTCYLMYGVFVYAYQGQYTLALAYQGISSYAWQTVGNVLALITGIIAGCLYGNIGLKVLYIYIVEDWMRGPPLLSKMGIKLWFVMCICYWAIAFVVGSAIPQVQTVSGLIAAICILQFTYTFPFLFIVAFLMIEDASKADGPFVPGTKYTPIDTWRSSARWSRGIVGDGLVTKRFAFKFVNFILFLASATTAGLGMYGSGESIYQVFQAGAATSFGCTPPV